MSESSLTVYYHKVVPKTAAILAGAEPLALEWSIRDANRRAKLRRPGAPGENPLRHIVPFPSPLLVQDHPISLSSEQRTQSDWEAVSPFVTLELQATFTPEQSEAWTCDLAGPPLSNRRAGWKEDQTRARKTACEPGLFLVPSGALAGLNMVCQAITVHRGALISDIETTGKKKRKDERENTRINLDIAWDRVADAVTALVVALQSQVRFHQSSVTLVVEDLAFKESIIFTEFRQETKRLAEERTPQNRAHKPSALHYYVKSETIPEGHPDFGKDETLRPAKRGDPMTRKFTFTLEIEAWLKAGGFPPDRNLGVRRQDPMTPPERGRVVGLQGKRLGAQFATGARMLTARRALEGLWVNQGLLRAGDNGKGCSSPGCGRPCWPYLPRRGPKHEYNAPRYERRPRAPKDVPMHKLKPIHRDLVAYFQDASALCWTCWEKFNTENAAHRQREHRAKKKRTSGDGETWPHAPYSGRPDLRA